MKTTTLAVFDRQGMLLAAVVLFLTFPLVGNATAQTCVQPPAGLVGWWPGDGNADDIIGSNGGTLENGATFVPGRVNQAFKFNDTFQQFVMVPHSSSLDIQHELTIDAWVMKKGNCEPLNCWMVAKSNQDFSFTSENGRYGIFIADAFYWSAGENGRVALSFNTGILEDVVLGTTIILDDTWYHVAGTWDGITAKIYVNGVLEKSVPKIGLILPGLGQGSLAIGAQVFTQGEFFNGLIDEVEVYNRALTAAEIQAIYNAGSTVRCKVREIDYLVSFVPLPSTYRTTSDPANCPSGFAGKFSFEARLTNRNGSPPISDLVVQAKALTNSNLLHYADGGNGGVGSTFPVLKKNGYSDGTLTPGESVDVHFSICLKDIKPFTFFVDVLGMH